MMGRKSLSARAVQSKLDAGMHLVGECPGLYLNVTAAGSKSWILRTIVRGKRRDIGLGSFPTITLADARTHGRELRDVARGGGDPLAGRNQQEIPSFEEAAERVHQEQILTSTKNPKHQAQWISTLRQYAYPKIGTLGVDEVTSGDILAILTPIWSEKPETARRLKQRIKTVFAWSRQAGFRETGNPAEDVATALPKQRKKPEHFSSMPWRELPEFWERLQTRDAMAARALSFLILTAARTGEVIGATWDEFDLEAGVWTVPASRMKADAEHRKPLSNAGLEVIRSLEGLHPELVFVGPSGERPLSNMAMLTLLKRMGFGQYTVHGFRTSFRVWAAEETSYSREVAEMCLAHDVRGAVERAYARTDFLDKRQIIMDEWSRVVLVA